MNLNLLKSQLGLMSVCMILGCSSITAYGQVVGSKTYGSWGEWSSWRYSDGDTDIKWRYADLYAGSNVTFKIQIQNNHTYGVTVDYCFSKTDNWDDLKCAYNQKTSINSGQT